MANSKNNKIIIALDAMGGDYAPRSVVEGASLALKKNPNLYFKIFGDETRVRFWINKCKNLEGNYTLYHTEGIISSSVKPSEAIRSSTKTSMRMAIECVQKKEAMAIVSSGNTGVLMGLSMIVLRPMEGVIRPAIITYVPTKKDPCVLLDLGANSSNTKEQLIQFAVMGAAYYKCVLGKNNPSVALLNIGSENIKGNELVQEAAYLIQKQPLINYVGFAEGNDIFTGNFDVIVTDGFTGNIALKVLEGTSKFIKYKVFSLFRGSIVAKLGLFLLGILAFFRIKKFREEVDTRNYNGAMLIGLQGISVKSHGNSDKKAFATAISVAYKLSVADVNNQIKKELQGIINT